MFSAVVYSSNTGSCKKYAELISEELSIPSFELGKHKNISDGKVVYIGWLCAGKIKGLGRARQFLNIGAVVQVGMAPVKPETESESRKKNAVDPAVPLFCLQGALDLSKLSLPVRLIMKKICEQIAEEISELPNPNAQELATLKMAVDGVGEPASWDVSDVIEWCSAH